ncbi:MAG: response regulator [Proteobacteria bacterium]|nr:response regulator [Pseudomonadota bacterium]
MDDEKSFIETIEKRLKKRGFAPYLAESGKKCLEILKDSTIHIVVSDVKMPGIGGIDLLKKIKQDYPAIEVILLTGHANPNDGVEGIKQGAFDYLTKPIELEHLIGKINQAWDKIQRIKEKKEEEAFRERMKKQLIANERLASLGTLSAGVAHEINNPLAIIKESAGWMNTIISGMNLSTVPRLNDLKTAIDKIEKSVERARRITHQLLSSVKKQDTALSEIRLNEFLQETIHLVKRSLPEKNIKMSLDTRHTDGILWTDPYQLRQILINLFTNSARAISNEGWIDLTVADTGDLVSISLKDNGEGIAYENLEKIFEPFFTTRAPGEGTGLGLFITRGIVEKLGGKIEVESQVGEGALFTLVLPKFNKNCDTQKGRN